MFSSPLHTPPRLFFFACLLLFSVLFCFWVNWNVSKCSSTQDQALRNILLCWKELFNSFSNPVFNSSQKLLFPLRSHSSVQVPGNVQHHWELGHLLKCLIPNKHIELWQKQMLKIFEFDPFMDSRTGMERNKRNAIHSILCSRDSAVSTTSLKPPSFKWGQWGMKEKLCSAF